MLNFLIIIKTKHWNRRRKRVTKIINQILNKKEYFNFENKHIYNYLITTNNIYNCFEFKKE